MRQLGKYPLSFLSPSIIKTSPQASSYLPLQKVQDRLSRINKRYDRSVFQSVKTPSPWIIQNLDPEMELYDGGLEKLRSPRFITYNLNSLQLNTSMSSTQTKENGRNQMTKFSVLNKFHLTEKNLC